MNSYINLYINNGIPCTSAHIFSIKLKSKFTHRIRARVITWAWEWFRSYLTSDRQTRWKAFANCGKPLILAKYSISWNPSWNVIERIIFIHIRKSIAQVNCSRTVFFANNFFHRQFFNFLTQPWPIPDFSSSSIESSVTKKLCTYDNRIISYKYIVMMSIHLNAYINSAGVLHARAHVCVCLS